MQLVNLFRSLGNNIYLLKEMQKWCPSANWPLDHLVGPHFCIFAPLLCQVQGSGVTAERYLLCVELTEPLAFRRTVMATRKYSIDLFIVAAYNILKYGRMWKRKMFTQQSFHCSPCTVSCKFKNRKWWEDWVS